MTSHYSYLAPDHLRAAVARGEVSEVLVVLGEPSGTRTRDPLIKSQVLYRLS